MNAITITGNLVADPEKANNQGETVIANFRIGNSEYVNGESKDNGFFDVTAFNAQAVNVLEQLKKGSRVVVTGRLQHRTFDRPDGSRGGRTSLAATAIGISLEFAPKDAS
jgi:single-strand DNA-binding protein